MNIILTLFLCLIALLYILDAVTAIVPGSIPVFPSSGGAQIAVTEARHTRKVFYVGGEYNKTATGTILKNQIYVEQLTPAGGVTQPRPLILIHGGVLSGDLWLNKPDGGRGWASFWLDRGYKVYIVDDWSVGRSGSETSSAGGRLTVEAAEQGFTAPELYNEYYQARFHTQWPGNGSIGDPAFDDFYSKVLPITIGAQAETVMRSAICELLRTTGPAILIAHSIGEDYALHATDACAQSVAAHVSVEGDQAPFGTYNGDSQGMNRSMSYRPYEFSSIPLTFEPPVTNFSQLSQDIVGTTTYNAGLLSNYSCVLQASPARQLPNLANVPMLFLTGDASLHVTYEHCQVSFLQQAGVKVNFTVLAEEGIRGNGHFMMLEKNSDQIALFITRWIERTVT